MKKILSDTFIVAALTLVSQVLGYVREMLFAYYLGTSSALEAFQVAETIPLLFTQIFISAIPLALTPLLIRERNKGEERLIHSAIAIWGVFLLIIGIFIWICPGIFVNISAPGFKGEQYALTCRLVTILAPNVFFLSIVALYNAYINSNRQFIIPTMAALCLNVFIIIMQIVSKGNVYMVAVGSVLGGIVMFAINVVYCRVKYKFRFNYKYFSKEDAKKIIVAVFPVVLISLFSSFNLLMDKCFASKLSAGSVAVLSYTYKIINLPVYLFSTSVIKVMLPNITSLIEKKEDVQLSQIIRKIVLICLVCGIVVIFGIHLIGKECVSLLFGRGKFDVNDINKVSEALKIYSWGIVAMALNSFFQSVSYAAGRYLEPLKILIIQVAIYLCVTTICYKELAINAIILGNVVAYIAAIVAWILLLRKKYNINVL